MKYQAGSFHIQLDLFGLEEYYDLIQTNMPRLLEEKSAELVTLAKLLSNDEQQLVEWGGKPIEFEVLRVNLMMEFSYPRIIWQAYWVGFWSFFESAIKSVADSFESPESFGRWLEQRKTK